MNISGFVAAAASDKSKELFSQVLEYYKINGIYVWEQFVRHFLISIYGVLFAALIFIPLGLVIAHKKKLPDILIQIANVMQTVPALAMLSILMIGMGLGAKTVIAAVMIYSVLPILKNTVTAVRSVPYPLTDAAKGMGMTTVQRILKLELPLSVSVILAGIRNALVVGIGITAVGTFIGAGGLGDIISRGINVAGGSSIILAGALPTAMMAVIIDIALGKLERRLLPDKRIEIKKRKRKLLKL